MNTITRKQFADTYGQEELSKLQPLTGLPRSTTQNVSIGFAKGAGDTARFAQDIVSKAPGVLAKTLPGGEFVAPAIDRGMESLKNKFQESVGLTGENLKAQNTPQLVGKGLEIGAEFLTPFVAGRLANLASKTPTALKTSEAGGFVKKGLDTVKEFVTNPKLAFGKQNVSPQLESSANRLFLDGTERLKDPIATYDKYVEQARKATSDIKTDPPIAVVGESIGDSFKSVVQQRRNVGKVMSEELKKISGVQTDVLPTIDTFVADLSQEGLVYDRVAKTIKQTTKQTKMGADDLNLLEKYATELQKLGSKPTVGELDAFMSRLPSEIDVYKSGKNITGTTNAERIIKKSLSDLREQFSPTKNPSFGPYYDARKQYANLSDFIEEGSGFLGKVTQSGDFAKDASLAKSAVQSILNNGKKDWLVKLEELSGYNALDDSVLALQAMKDAGDFRGLSLLESLSSEVPTSARGVTEKVLNFALEKAGRAVGGTPEEQTRAFLQALKEGAAKEAGTNAAFGAAAGVNPNTGEFDPTAAVVGAGLAALGVKAQPKAVAQKLNAGEYRALKEYNEIRSSPNAQVPVGTFMKITETLEKSKVDVGKLTFDELDDYVAALVKAFEDSL